MTRFIMLIIVLLISHCLRAQRYVERVYLKDSIGYREGYVIEQIPGSYMKLYRPKQGDTLVIASGQVAKIVKYFKGLPRGPIGWAGQQKRNYKAVYVEMGGRSFVYSLNFDMRAAKGSRNGWGISSGISRLGFTLLNASTSDSVYRQLNFIPISINYLLGKNRHFLELGVGGSFIFGGLNGYNIKAYAFADKPTAATGMFGHFLLGYRYAPPKSSIILRLSATPLFNSSSEVLLWGGLSIGYQFW